MTSTKSNYGRRITEYGIDLIYPRNPLIAGASAFASWYGQQWSIMIMPPILKDVVINGLYGGGNSENRTLWESFRNGVMFLYSPVAYSTYAVPYLPQIHIALGLGAAITVSMTLNLVAQVVFGIKSNKSHQIEPLDVALGVPTETDKLKKLIKQNPIITLHKPQKRAATVSHADINKKAKTMPAKALKADESESTESSTDTITNSEITESVPTQKTKIITARILNQTAESEEAEIKSMLYDENDQKRKNRMGSFAGGIIKVANFIFRC